MEALGFKPSYRNKLRPVWNFEDLSLDYMCQKASSPTFGGQLQGWGSSATALGMDESATKPNDGLRRDKSSVGIAGPGKSGEPRFPFMAYMVGFGLKT